MKLILLAAISLCLFDVEVKAEEAVPKNTSVQGAVKVVGSAYNAQVTLTTEKDKTQIVMCRGAKARKIGRLSGMILAVHGKWSAKNKKKCFAAEGFTIEKTPGGRKPLVGTLYRIEASFVVTGDDGKKHKLERVTSGLKSLLGQKVIVDVKPLRGAKGDSSWKVVSYSAFPD